MNQLVSKFTYTFVKWVDYSFVSPKEDYYETYGIITTKFGSVDVNEF